MFYGSNGNSTNGSHINNICAKCATYGDRFLYEYKQNECADQWKKMLTNQLICLMAKLIAPTNVGINFNNGGHVPNINFYMNYCQVCEMSIIYIVILPMFLGTGHACTYEKKFSCMHASINNHANLCFR